jgi:hypothetical protein
MNSAKHPFWRYVRASSTTKYLPTSFRLIARHRISPMKTCFDMMKNRLYAFQVHQRHSSMETVRAGQYRVYVPWWNFRNFIHYAFSTEGHF